MAARRWFGWGWSPVTWQGRAVVVAYVAILITAAAVASRLTTLVVAVVVTVVLFGVMTLTGGRPGQRS